MKNSEKKQGTYVNIDNNWLWMIYESSLADLSDAEGLIRRYVRGYRDSGISDLLFCSFCQMSMFPSKVLPWGRDKYFQKIENGIEVDYTKLHVVKHLFDFYEVLERDPYDIAIEETRKLGMNAWLSVRMNDCHFNHEKTNFLHGELYYDALKNGWVIGEHVAGYYMGECYNYAVKTIYDKMLAYVFETVDRYDVDGLELDFQREIFCFDYMKNPECHKIMTAFVSSVREYLREKEKERGHAIKLGVRLVRDIKHNKIFGFDVENWVKIGLVDLVVPTSRWETTDSDMPIGEWRKLVDGTDVELCAGVEALLFLPYDNSVETVKGFATQYLDAGADSIYLYNYYRTRCEEREIDAQALAQADFDENYDPRLAASDESEKRLKGCWLACSSREDAAKGTRRHVMTFSEVVMAPTGQERYNPLPARIDTSVAFSVQTGRIGDADSVIYIGVSPDTEIDTFVIDGCEAAALGETSDAFVSSAPSRVETHFRKETLDASKYLAYSFRAGKGNLRDVKICGKGEIRYLEIRVDS